MRWSERVIVGTTVQEKAIALPVDSRLIEIVRHKVLKRQRTILGIVIREVRRSTPHDENHLDSENLPDRAGTNHSNQILSLS